MQVHELHVQWRPDLFESLEELYSEERFQTVLRQRQLYVAKLDNAVVGYVLVQMETIDRPGRRKRKVMIVDEFCVHESCRGHGIGKAMMGDIHALAKAFRCSDLQLKVYPQNDDAVGFYQQCGFQIQNIGMQKKV
jgi:ribosomal protein S18 acetylase RimI-like enzyme